MTQMQRPLNRITPSLPVTAMRTHAILAPVETHWRKATCGEVGCLAFHHGWSLSTTGLDEGMIWQAKNAGRRFTVSDDGNGAVLLFEPGQPCFKASQHRVRADRPEIFIARDGDWRGNPTGEKPIIFSGADAWKDSLGTNLDACRG